MDGKSDEMKHQVELGEVYAQSRQNAQQIDALRNDLNDSIGRIQQAIERMGEKVNAASTPNFSTMAVWAGVILTVIGMVFTPVAFFAIREYDRQDKMLEKLDINLQREYQLTAQRIDASIESLNKISIERHNDAVDGLHRLQGEIDGVLEFKDSQIRDDLSELRQRRYMDGLDTQKRKILEPAQK